MIKVIHTADVHLGASPDMGYPWEAERSASLWYTFERLIEETKSCGADLLLISGDLFHKIPSETDLKRIDRLFRKIPETTVVLCAGNHDYICRDNPYTSFEWSPNVIGLWTRELASVPIPRLNTRVYGLSYYNFEAAEDLYKDAICGDGGINILLLHGGDAKHSPVNKEELAKSGFDYIAMGHIHKPGYVLKNKAAYCGALTPVDRNDIGAHGYICAEISKGRADIKFVPFAPYSYEEIILKTDENDTLISLEKRVRDEVEKRGRENSYKLLVTGSSSAAEGLSLKRLWEYGRFVEINNETGKAFDTESLCRKYRGTILEEYIRAFEGKSDKAELYALKEGIRIILNAMD